MSDPPTTLEAILNPGNVFSSFYKHFNAYFDRGKFTATDFPAFPGSRIPKQSRDLINSARGIILSTYSVLAGGRGQNPNLLHIIVLIKRDEDIYYNASLSLIPEILRVFQSDIDMYDFAELPETRIGSESVYPVFVSAETDDINFEISGGSSEDSIPMKTITMSFNVYSSRETEKYDTKE